jgi:hypothetical protein
VSSSLHKRLSVGGWIGHPGQAHQTGLETTWRRTRVVGMVTSTEVPLDTIQKKKTDCFSLRRTYALPLSVFFLPVKHGRVALLSSPTPFLLSRPQAVSRGAAAVDVRQGVGEEAIVVVSRLLL